ncbi:hypothetical protein [Alteromonas mediterranea]|uniref:hypothetical protein n=1 Tax=Alteromonas mediterranea TaxID=314275 RepID=UPI00035551E7|nr:hypothetical protein [Alteromonas mediterranea]AGP85848.1 hypothetical protein I607_10265 [Alteromonas mediterranea U4]AGP89980.1 hypothetical protein I876_10605 [Alteromonas mediterranea U7]AGP93806.1 hypothetical protein I634_10475 [Alteromonas mediterranea U8]
MISKLPKPILKAEALKLVIDMANKHKAGQEIELNHFFRTMMLYASSATEEDLNRLLRINMAEVLKHRRQVRKFDA